MDRKSTTHPPMSAQSPGTATSSSTARSRRRSRKTTAQGSTGADAVLARIRAHLGEGRYRDAQRLAEEAAGQFPSHRDIATLNRGLNGSSVSTRPANGHSRREELAWLDDPPESVRGKLVALIDSKMVACADSVKELKSLLEPMKLEKLPLVHRVEA